LETEDTEVTRTQNSFERELNQHGFGFHYSVLREAQKVSGHGSRWRFLASEVPVEVGGLGTRIDFILEYSTDLSGFRDYLICECKRVNPAFSKWCFIRAPYTKRNSIAQRLIAETARARSGVFRSVGKAQIGLRTAEVFHVALPVRSNVQGDAQPKGSTRDAVEDAVGQVLKGMNGYVNLLGSNDQLIAERTALLLPVVFTTAELWGSDSDLSNADLGTGAVDLSKGNFNKLDWLWLQYNTSPGIKHSFSPETTMRADALETLMDDEFVRTVAIVSSAGIADFLEYTTDTILR
jgi:hypothetical protein